MSSAVQTDAGLEVILHPLPILNISEHSTRNRYANGKKAVGALLGTQKGREVSIVNSFELVIIAQEQMKSTTQDPADVDMHDDSDAKGNAEAGPSTLPKLSQRTVPRGTATSQISEEFLERRRQQYKETFPTLELVGWYSTGNAPDADDVYMQSQLGAIIETPLFLLYSDSEAVPTSGSDLPIAIFESALGENSGGGGAASDPSSLKAETANLVRIEYKVETGEAERIAVEGAATATGAGSMGESGSSLIASLTTQRDAIQMLHDRMRVLLQYVTGVAQGTAKPDHAILREIGSVVSSLPAMTDARFQDEYMTEYNDVQLTSYLASLTRSLATLSDLTDKFNAVHQIDELGGGAAGGEGAGKGRLGGGGRGGGGKWRG